MTFHFSTGMKNHMDTNHQDKTTSKLIEKEVPASAQQEPLSRNEPKKAGAKWRWGFSEKTGWDWVQIFIQLLAAIAIPIALFLATQWFSGQQSQASEVASERQHSLDLQIAATRYANDQLLASDQQRETALRAFMDDISDLLLNHGLQKSQPGAEIRVVARVRTLAALRNLDAPRKKSLLLFLSEANLIEVKTPVISLVNANLSGAKLYSTNLRRTNLSGAYLNSADLYSTYLNDADLSFAYLNGADLRGADLSGADLTGANLQNALVTQEQLAQAKSLKGVTMPDGSIHP